MATKEAVCLTVAALALSGCAGPSGYRTLFTQCPCYVVEPAPVTAEPAPRLVAPVREPKRRPPRTAAAPQTLRRAFTTDPSAYPPIPRFDSPEWERERRQSERLDKKLDETLKGVCRGC